MVCLKFSYVNPLQIYTSLLRLQITDFGIFPSPFLDTALGTDNTHTYRALRGMVFSQFREHSSVHRPVSAVTKRLCGCRI